MNVIPTVTVDQMREIDRLMVNEMGISVTMMMEHAGRDIVWVARKMLKNIVEKKRILVLAHKGNNGGDGLAAARMLINLGAEIKVYLTTEPRNLTSKTKAQFDILKRMNANIIQFTERTKQKFSEEKDLNSADLIIDALLGFNIKGNPRGPIDQVIEIANNVGKPILAVDIPSGLNGDNGKAYHPTIKATATITLGLAKTGLVKPEAKKYVGDLYVGDITVPQQVYEQINIDNPQIFKENEVLKVN